MWFTNKNKQSAVQKYAESVAPAELTFSNQTQPAGDTFRERLGGGNSLAGPNVTEKTAMNFAAVFACIRAKAETIGSLPFPVYQRLKNGGKQRFREHSGYKILNHSPDGNMSSMQWIEAGVGHLEGWGNWFNEIEFSRSKDILACHLICPNKVRDIVRTKSGRLEYKVEGSIVPVPAEYMLHIPNLGFDGVRGYSPIRQCKSAIGLAIAAEEFGAAWFGNGSKGSGVIKSPKELSPKARENLREELYGVHGGPSNYGKWMLLQEGMSIETLGIPPEEAQFLQTRTFQLQEICRIFRISPIVVQDLSRSTFSNNEQEMISFVTHTLRPLARRIEAEINRKFFDYDEDLFAEILLDGLLRGDSATRNAAYVQGRQWGWLNADDICELENRNPLPNGQGQIYVLPSGSIDLSSLTATVTDKPALPAPDEQPAIDVDHEVVPETEPEPVAELSAKPSEAAYKASLACVQDNFGRMVRRESEAIVKAASKPAEFLSLIDLFYGNQRSICERAMAPSLNAFAALTEGDLPNITDQFCDSGMEQLLELSGTCSAAELPERVEQWTKQRVAEAEKIIGSLAT